LLLINKAGTVPSDLVLIDEYQQSLWQAKQQTQVVTPSRKNKNDSFSYFTHYQFKSQKGAFIGQIIRCFDGPEKRSF
jgi:hypothetical protein